MKKCGEILDWDQTWNWFFTTDIKSCPRIILYNSFSFGSKNSIERVRKPLKNIGMRSNVLTRIYVSIKIDGHWSNISMVVILPFAI